MQKPETFVHKDMRGNWKAESSEMITDTMQLSVSTFKTFSGSVVTTASVSHVDGAFVSHTMYQDFSKRLANVKYARTTSKVVEAQHAEAMAGYEAVKAEALAFYTKDAKDQE